MYVFPVFWLFKLDILLFTRENPLNGLLLLLYFSDFPFSFLVSLRSMQAQIKILNLMDKKEKTAQALKKKKSTLMELEAQAQKVSGIFFLSIVFSFFLVLFLLRFRGCLKVL